MTNDYPPIRVMRPYEELRKNQRMLNELSNQLADAVAAAAPSVMQVHGRRRPASGLVYAHNVIVTTMDALGREDGLHVRAPDNRGFDAELAGWDPTTHLAVLKVGGLEAPPIVPATAEARVGHLALAIARSWSNAVTASAGIVSVIGGPLPTSRRRAIDQVIRTTAPMHGGFAGGAFIDTSGALIGVATAASIRGLGVVIPVGIAWKTAAAVLEHGRLHRGYLGIVGQAVTIPENQREAGSRDEAVLITGVMPESPAAKGNLLVGDLLVALNGAPIESPEDLMDQLYRIPIGQQATARLARGGKVVDVSVTIGARPSR
jgi:S1-C subfamily serine protease